MKNKRLSRMTAMVLVLVMFLPLFGSAVHISGAETDPFPEIPGVADQAAFRQALIETVDAASVRLKSPAGLRFASRVDHEKISYLRQLAEDGQIFSVRMGTVITPASYAREVNADYVGITRAALDRLFHTTNYLDIAFGGEYFAGDVTTNLGEGNYMVGSIVNIKNQNTDREFFAYGYVEVTMNDGTSFEISNGYCIRSVQEVAQAALLADVSYDNAQKAVLKRYAAGPIDTKLRAVNLKQTSSAYDIGIAADNVRLAWELEATERGSLQAAYRVVIRDADKQVWDSDWVTSSAQTGVLAQHLQGETVYYWSVNVRDQYGNESGFSAEASFETAPEKVGGIWIGGDLLRLEFTLDQPLENVVRARSYIGAASPIEIHLNGKKVGDQVLGQEPVADVEIYYHTYDILPLLQSETNAIGIICGDPWVYPFNSRACGMLRIYYADGTVQTIETNEDWNCSDTSMITRSNWFTGEDVNGNLMVGWDTVGFDDSEWKAGSDVGSPVSNGMLRLQANSGTLYCNYDLTDNYVIETSVRITSGTMASIVFGTPNSYPHMWQFDAKNGKLRMHHASKWTSADINIVSCSGLTLNDWIELRIEVSGTTVKTYVGGTLVNTETIAAGTTAGQVGFRCATGEAMNVDYLRIMKNGAAVVDDSFDSLNTAFWNLTEIGELVPAVMGTKIVEEIKPVDIYAIDDETVDASDVYVKNGVLYYPDWKNYYSLESFSGDYTVELEVRTDSVFSLLFGHSSKYPAMWQFSGNKLKMHMPGDWSEITTVTVNGMDMTKKTKIRLSVVGDTVSVTVNDTIDAGSITLASGACEGVIGFRSATAEGFELDWIRVTQNGQVLLEDDFDFIDTTKWDFPAQTLKYVIDFGTNMAGYVRVDAKLNRGDTVKIAYSELVNEDGTIFANTTCHYPTCTYTFTGGEDSFAPYFFYNGFQYIEVSSSVMLSKDCFTACVISNDVPKTGSFESSSERLNDVLELYYRSQLSNMVTTYTDCPTREKQGWTGDASVTKQAASILFGDYTTAEAYIRLMSLNVFEDGMPTVIIPRMTSENVRRNYFDIPWASAYFVFPYVTYMQTGDTYYIDLIYDSLVKVFAYYRSIAGADGVPDKITWGDWMGYDSHDKLNNNRALAAVYAYQSGMLLSQMATITGREHTELDAYLKELYDAIQTRYLKDGYFAADTQANNATALDFDLVPPDQRDRFVKRLIQNVTSYGSLRTGVLGTYSLYNVLSAENQHKLLLDITLTDKKCSFGYMLDNGATSMWEFWDKAGETWDSETKNCTYDSQNHCMLGGSMATWLFEGLGGIRCTEAGYHGMTLRPGLESELTWVNTSIDTVIGRVVSNWTYEDGVLDWTITVPANAEATVLIPLAQATAITESGADVFQKDGDGLTYIGTEDGAYVYRVGSGTYTFHVTCND